MANQRLRSLIKAAAENVQAANRPNPYVVGFMGKCAEAGIPEQAAMALLEKKAISLATGAGILGGGALGALLSKPETVVGKDGKEKKKYHRFRNAAIGATLGGVTGALGDAAYHAWTPAGQRAVAAAKAEEAARRAEAVEALKSILGGLGLGDPSSAGAQAAE